MVGAVTHTNAAPPMWVLIFWAILRKASIRDVRFRDVGRSGPHPEKQQGV